MFSLAHLSDLHLGPLPKGASRRHFALKRTIGAFNWRLNRHRVHSPTVAMTIAEDIKLHAPDHVALTGDIVNVAAHDEFPAAAEWLRVFGPPDWISFVPGNHDTYVRCDWQHGLSHLEAYMQGDMRVKQTQSTAQIATPFPYVRLRRNVALIGISTAVPQPLHRRHGTAGPHPARIAGLPALRPARARLCPRRDDPSPAAARTGKAAEGPARTPSTCARCWKPTALNWCFTATITSTC